MKFFQIIHTSKKTHKHINKFFLAIYYGFCYHNIPTTFVIVIVFGICRRFNNRYMSAINGTLHIGRPHQA
jgi:hypothetical protein